MDELKMALAIGLLQIGAFLAGGLMMFLADLAS